MMPGENQEADVPVVDEEEVMVDDEGSEEDVDVVNDGSTLDEDTNLFDHVIGALEDIMLEPEFEQMREDFNRQHCVHFEDNEDNKLIYTDIFNQYTAMIEKYIDRRLTEAVPGFDMQKFQKLLQAHQEELVSDVFEFLNVLGDFEAFKELMLSYKQEKEHGNSFQISCTTLKVHTEEQEDGEERPDLDFGIQVSAYKQ